MFAIYGGKTEFNQWDLNQFVTNPCMQEGDEVVFYNSHGATYVVNAFAQNGEILADVPNYLLQTEGNILVDLGQGLERHTECRTTFTVVAQAKPEGYDCQYNVPARPVKNGGVSSWNDLTDKPFYAEDGMVEVLAETDATESTDPTFGKCWVISKAPNLTAGETYAVIYNGVSYDCVCYSGEDTGLSVARGAFALGNFSVVGGANTGEPFAMLVFPDISIIALDLTGATSVRIGIMVEGEVVHKLDDKFLPCSIYTVVVDSDVSTNTTVVDKTFAEVAEKVKDPTVQVRVFARATYEGVVMEYNSLNFTDYNVSNGDIVFTAPCNEFCFWSMTMKSDGSIDFGTISYKGLDS